METTKQFVDKIFEEDWERIMGVEEYRIRVEKELEEEAEFDTWMRSMQEGSVEMEEEIEENLIKK